MVPTDFDNRRDIDLLLVRPSAPPALFRNMRDGTFKDVARDVGLAVEGAASMAAAGDVNKDGYLDFFHAGRDAGQFAVSDGRGGYVVSAADRYTAGATAAQFVDYDNDGLLDLLAATPGGIRVLRNLGTRWLDVTARAGMVSRRTCSRLARSRPATSTATATSMRCSARRPRSASSATTAATARARCACS